MNRMFGLLFVLLLHGCSCPGTRTESTGSGDHPAGSPAAVQQSFSYIEGIIDSVIIVDEEHFQLAITLVSARAGSGGESLAEQGTQLRVAPATTDDARAKLSRFRSARRGDKFSGSIARSADGGWLLLDAEPR